MSDRLCKRGHVLVYPNNKICGQCNAIAGSKGGKATQAKRRIKSPA